MQDADDARQGTPINVDESTDFDIGAADILLGILTLPLLFWALMYAVTGAEQIVATRRARYRLYAVLLVLEVLIAIALVWWFTR